MSYFKIQIPFRLSLMGLNSGNLCRRRAFPTPFHESIELGFFPFRYHVDRSIRFISNIPGDSKFFRQFLCMDPEENSLHMPEDVDGEVLHTRPLYVISALVDIDFAGRSSEGHRSLHPGDRPGKFRGKSDSSPAG